MPESIISQGFSLLIYGMGSVMLFLALLVVVTDTLSKLLARYFPEPLPAPAPAKPAAAAPPVDARTRVIIAAAIAKHRAGRR